MVKTAAELRHEYIKLYRRNNGGVSPSIDKVKTFMANAKRISDELAASKLPDSGLHNLAKKKATEMTDKVREVAGTDVKMGEVMEKVDKIVQNVSRIENLKNKKVSKGDESFVNRLERAQAKLGFDSPMMGSIVSFDKLDDRINGLIDHWMTDLYMISEGEFIDMFNIARITLHGLEAKLSGFMTSLQNS